MKGKCLACHMNLEEGLLFCSITCACLAGYMSVRTDTKVKDIEALAKDKKLQEEMLSRPPLRERPERKYL